LKYDTRQTHKNETKIRIKQKGDIIEKKWDEMDQASREKDRKTIQALRKKRNELGEWYGGMKHSSADAWDHIKIGFVDVMRPWRAPSIKQRTNRGQTSRKKASAEIGLRNVLQ
jgi:hypothetical protein